MVSLQFFVLAQGNPINFGFLIFFVLYSLRSLYSLEVLVFSSSPCCIVGICLEMSSSLETEVLNFFFGDFNNLRVLRIGIVRLSHF